MKKITPLILGSLVLVFFCGLLFIAHKKTTDTYDGYLFLLQAKRLTQTAYQGIAFDQTRPRGLVILLSFFDKLCRIVSGSYASLNSFHILMIFLSSATLAVWFQLGLGLLTPLAAIVFGVGIFAHYLFWEQGTYVLADILTTGLVGLFWLVAFRSYQNKSLGDKKAWILLGAVGAAIAVTKYTFFFFFPCFLFLGYLFDKKIFSKAHLSWGLLNYVLVTEIIQRLFGSWKTGFWFSVKLHLPYARLLTSQAENVGYVSREPFSFYLRDLYHAYGPVFWGVMVGLAVWLIYKKGSAKIKYPLFLKLFFLIQMLFILFHHAIQHKEARYLLPLIPGILLLVCLMLDRGHKIVFHYAVLLALLFPLASTFTLVRNLGRIDDKAFTDETQRFINYLGESCKFVRACSRRIHGQQLDWTFYQYQNPALIGVTKYCLTKEPNVEAVKKKLFEGSFDDPTLDVCLVYGRSFYRELPLEPLKVYKPQACGRTVCYEERNFFANLGEWE